MGDDRRRLSAVLGWVAVFTLLVGVPTAYAKNWPPAVIVESSSMMHRDDEVTYGRVGTIDPGDLVLVKDVDGPEDVRTFVEGASSRYRHPGDVIVFHRAGDPAFTPIIHRAMAYVEVLDEGYRVRWDPDAPCEGNGEKDPTSPRWCRFPAEGILIPSASIHEMNGSPYKPNANGFVTKGDNPVTNRFIDPVAGISHDAHGRRSVVLPEWVEGKARGEVPWLGLVKLALAGRPNEHSPPSSYVKVGSAYAPADLWVSLAVALGVVIGGPLAYDGWRAWKGRGIRKG